MVAFYMPEQGCSLEAEYLVPLGLGDCTIRDGVLQADLPLSAEDIKRIEAEGFRRADIHLYQIKPEPAREDRRALVEAFGAVPSSTGLANGVLKVSFTKAIGAEGLATIENLGYEISELKLGA